MQKTGVDQFSAGIKSRGVSVFARLFHCENSFSHGQHRHQWRAPVSDRLSVKSVSHRYREQSIKRVSPPVPLYFIVGRIEPLQCRDIDDDAAAFGKVKSRGIKKPVLIVDVFQHIKHQQHVECISKFSGVVMNVVAIQLSAAANTAAQSFFVQVKTYGRNVVCVFDLPN